MSDTRYEEGDVVATPDGRGVVAAVLTADVEFPRGEDTKVEVDASDESPGYVVGLESVGSAIYRASSLAASSFDDQPEGVAGEAETEIVDQDVDGLDALPDGWDRQSVLQYWSSIGGSWEACVDDVSAEQEIERAQAHCSAMKDEVLRTGRWRSRF